ncbi:hypothetical protein SAMN02745157_0908 [Kaistia soli DSM 19436]|uniref:DUF2946 domain-containing protein n=1 Tax=Kaistia soli DSM 19436 TaxID=1122133 RepID=A0A1M4W8C1_9HYPH|nr:DUF2946 family protein [Kaistia soli]SHE77395.1 hypothetical protein SAMN02745157_0908 [Kaistia soli DSM 19436]
MLVALFLVVQALFSGVAAGARADVSLSGDVICSSSGGWSVAGPAGQPSDRTHLVDCCTLGCPMLGGAVPGPVAFSPPVHIHVLATLGAPASDHAVLVRAELAPLRSRAPPQA